MLVADKDRIIALLSSSERTQMQLKCNCAVTRVLQDDAQLQRYYIFCALE